MTTTPTEYPKTMVHPHAQKGTVTEIKGTDPVSGRPFTDRQGTPDRLPPVHVNTAEQEAEARTRGYHAYGETPPAMTHDPAEYPLMMCHPDHVDAVPDEKYPHKDETTGAVTIMVLKGKPEVLPHATVADAADEARMAAKGYRRMGTFDPVALEASIASPYVPGRVSQEWPKMVDGVMVQDPNVKPEENRYPMWVGDAEKGFAVTNPVEEAAARLKLGLPEMEAPKPVPSRQIAPDEIAPEAPRAPMTLAPATDEPRPMTHGEKVKAGRARKAVERAARAQSAA